MTKTIKNTLQTIAYIAITLWHTEVICGSANSATTLIHKGREAPLIQENKDDPEWSLLRKPTEYNHDLGRILSSDRDQSSLYLNNALAKKVKALAEIFETLIITDPVKSDDEIFDPWKENGALEREIRNLFIKALGTDIMKLLDTPETWAASERMVNGIYMIIKSQSYKDALMNIKSQYSENIFNALLPPDLKAIYMDKTDLYCRLAIFAAIFKSTKPIITTFPIRALKGDLVSIEILKRLDEKEVEDLAQEYELR